MQKTGNRSQVQGSTFNVKDREGIKVPEVLVKMLISPNNCQFDSNFELDLMKLTLFS